MRNALLALVLTATAHIQPAVAEPDQRSPEFYEQAREYIIACSRDWAESVVTGDMSKRRIYFADDFVGTSTAGTRYDKAAITRETGPATYTVSNTLNDVEIKFYDDVAIAFGDETWVKKDGSTGRYVWTDIWAYRDGQWQIVAAQDADAPVETED